MPARFVIILDGRVVDERGPLRDAGPALHAVVLQAIGAVGPDVAAALHASWHRPGRPDGPLGPYRPFALAPLQPVGPSAGGGAGRWRFEVRLLDDRLMGLLAEALADVRSVKVGHSSFDVVEAVVAPVEWQWLVLRRPPRTRWGLRFLTPTTFRTTSRSGEVRSQPLPTPEHVFGSLLRRWRHFAPPGLLAEHAESVVDQYLAVASFNLHTKRHLTKSARSTGPPHTRRRAGTWQVGCVGEAVYEVVRAGMVDDRGLRAVGALVAFAELAGVGDQTAKGMGCVEAFEPEHADHRPHRP